LPQRIASYDIALGIFGTTAKAPLVIPNKIFHYAACAKPIVTIDTPAIREVFTDDVNIKLIPPSEIALAETISKLVSAPDKLLNLGTAARDLMLSQYDARHIGAAVASACKDALAK
jgi:glycosyltransferase involved in cell wall biosynthesis